MSERSQYENEPFDVESTDQRLVPRITLAVREADDLFQKVGGSSRHWVIECLLPMLTKHGLAIVTAAEKDDAALAELAQLKAELSAIRSELDALTARLDIAPTHCVSNGQAGDESIVCSRCGVIVDDDELHDRADCLEHQLSGTEQAHDYVVKEMQRALDEVDSLRSELSALRPLSEAGTQGEWRAGRSDTVSYDGDGEGPYKCVYVDDPNGEMHRGKRLPAVVARGYSGASGEENCCENAALIAAAVNAVRRMLAREGGADGKEEP